MNIGVLSLQGDFDKHRAMLRSIGVDATLMREARAVESIDGLIIPGGESTTMGKLIMSFNLASALETRIKDEHMPVFGTCAGMILLADEIIGYDQYSLKALDVAVRRNAYGRQIESFEARISMTLPDGSAHDARGVFIRAPLIERAGSNVHVLAEYEEHPVLVQQGNVLAASFHPELTDDPTVHKYFCGIVEKVISNKQ